MPEITKVHAIDMELAYSDVGVGDVLVWLHGSGPGASALSNFAANLPAFSDFRNLLFDHPRYGNSDRPHIEGPLIPHSGERIVAALDALGVENFSIIGNSFGGGVAAWIAAHHPGRVKALVLMAPGGVQPAGLAPRELPYGLQLIFTAMAEGVDRELMTEFVNTMCVNKELATPQLIEQRLEAAIRNNPEWEGMPNIGDLSGDIHQIVAPTQLLWGKQDNFVPVSWALPWLEQISDSELHVLAHCGHWLQYERQTQFNELAGEFIRRNNS